MKEVLHTIRLLNIGNYLFVILSKYKITKLYFMKDTVPRNQLKSRKISCERLSLKMRVKNITEEILDWNSHQMKK